MKYIPINCFGLNILLENQFPLADIILHWLAWHLQVCGSVFEPPMGKAGITFLEKSEEKSEENIEKRWRERHCEMKFKLINRRTFVCRASGREGKTANQRIWKENIKLLVSTRFWKSNLSFQIAIHCDLKLGKKWNCNSWRPESLIINLPYNCLHSFIYEALHSVKCWKSIILSI